MEKRDGSKQINICFIFPRFERPTGSERHTLKLASELANMGHKITIYTHGFHPDCRGMLSSRKVKIVETGFYPISLINNHDLISALDILLLPLMTFKIRGSFDLFHAFSWHSLFCAFFAKKLHSMYENVPIVYYCLEPPRFVYDLKKSTFSGRSLFEKFLINLLVLIIKHMDNYFVGKVDKIISNSDWTAKQVKEIYGRVSEIVYPGIEVERFNKYSKEDAREQLGLDKNLKVFISVSELHRKKRIDKALEVYSEYSKKFDRSKFFIIGDGPEERNLKNLVENMHLKNVEFTGRLLDKKVSLYYAAADYFIFTAKNEPFGIAPLEAKVAGCQLLGQGTQYPVLSWRESAERVQKIHNEIIKERNHKMLSLVRACKTQ